MTVDQVISQVARENRTTPEHVRKEIEAIILEAQNNPDPAVQKRWAQIPHKGAFVTLEEFLPYAAAFLRTKL